MNKATLIGRLTRDVEMRTTQNGKSVASFTLAVDRRFKQDEQQPTADFIPIVVWGKTAEVCGKYLVKGNRCGVAGRIQTRSYEAKDGSKRYVTEIIAEEVEFLESRKSGGQFGESVPDEEIPF